MTQPPYPPPQTYQTSSSLPYQSIGTLDVKDTEHLRILSICWYIVSALQCVGLLGGLILVVLGVVLLVGGGSADEEPGIVFLIFGIIAVLITFFIAFLSFLTARSLARRRWITLIYICAAIMCISPPLGTLLGIFTFIVLGRPSVKAAFR